MADSRGENDTVPNFLLRTMVERDPKKRRVKPVESHMLQLQLDDLDDSSDDSDYQVPDQVDGDDSNSEDSGDNDDDDDDDNDEEEEERSEVEPEDTSSSAGSEIRKKEGVSVGELIEQARMKQALARQRIAAEGAKPNQLRFLICSVCLGDISEEEDEIVECDGCGVSVHEGCYGIQDSDSVMSTVSSSSTEPWFCDACKAGNSNPVCELCPNIGGILKETDVGKWVHLVCALYIPGVAFGDVDKLSPVTLFEMPYSKWGSKACSLCEDERFSRSGVCISCDAGMCRNYFHVTCAQREGLLSEASPEEEIADPFFAYCKLHADKMIVRGKRRNWLALQSQVRQFRERVIPDVTEKARIERKLQHHCKKYQAAAAAKIPPWVPTQKMPRLLTSSPSACRRLIKKAELLGINTQTLQVQQSASDNVVDIRRKWHVPAAFSVEFVSYYLDRGERMISMKTRLDELLVQNTKLQEEEHTLRSTFDHLTTECNHLKQSNTELRDHALKLLQVLNSAGAKKFTTPEILKPKKSPVKTQTKSGRRSDSDVTLNQCGICKKTKDQHLLARCDTCHLYYHLGCLDPPLSRMPKKTKLQGWQCSECDKTDNEEKEEEVDMEAPRRLREHIKEPIKFTPPSISPALKKNLKFKFKRKSIEPKRPMKRRSDSLDTPDVGSKENEVKGRTKEVKVEEPVKEKVEKREVLQPTPSKRRATQPVAKPGRSSDVRTECSKCSGQGDNSNLVRCDECNRCFHFHCLNPPVKKSPKQRGYNWHCENCDPSGDEEEVAVEKKNVKSPPTKKKKK